MPDLQKIIEQDMPVSEFWDGAIIRTLQMMLSWCIFRNIQDHHIILNKRITLREIWEYPKIYPNPEKEFHFLLIVTCLKPGPKAQPAT